MKIGFHIHALHIHNRPRLHDRIARLKPDASLVLNGIETARELAADFPDMLVVHRQTPDADAAEIGPPAAYIDAQRAALNNDRIIISLGNELENTAANRTMLLAGIAHAKATRARIEIYNVATGNPAYGSWPGSLLPILQAMQGADTVWLGAHEYFDRFSVAASTPHLIDRSYLIDATCNAQGLYTPPLLLTELGADSMLDIFRGWRKGMTPRTYAEALTQMLGIYKPRRYIKGGMIFCYGDSGGWADFDIEEGTDELFDLLEEYMSNNPEPQPAWIEQGILSLSSGVNLREGPSTAHDVIITVPAGQYSADRDDRSNWEPSPTKDDPDRAWFRVRITLESGAIVEGWMRSDVADFTVDVPEPDPDPGTGTPDPEPPMPPPLGELLKSWQATLIVERQALQAAVEAQELAAQAHRHAAEASEKAAQALTVAANGKTQVINMLQEDLDDLTPG